MRAPGASPPPWLEESVLVEVLAEADVYTARARAREMAAAMGFDPYACLEIETAVSELAGNTWYHGGGGRIFLRRERGAFSVTCLDAGPGFGERGGPPHGLGIGLAGAGRLMHRLRRGNRPGGGAFVRAERACRLEEPVAGSPAAPLGLELAVAWRSADGEVACGDGFLVTVEPGASVLAVVVDGLGHGEAAGEAAARVLEAVREHLGAPLDVVLAAAHHAARSTRGAAAGILRIGTDAVAWAGVGNVALTVAEGPRLSGTPGCLGVHPVRVRPRLVTPRPAALALASDGAGDVGAAARLGRRRALRSAEAAVARASGRDDATVLVVRSV